MNQPEPEPQSPPQPQPHLQLPQSRCAFCEAPIERRPGPGRPRTYCDKVCRRGAERWRARRRAEQPPGPAGAPADLRAFRQLYQGYYLRYALVRVGRGDAAVEAVERTFVELADRWPEVLRAPRPTAVAWSLLRQQLARRDGVVPLDGRSRRPVEAQRADARLLSRRLGMPLAEVADVLGADPARVLVLLRP